GDVDWFRFHAVAGQEYEFEVALLTLPDSVLTLYASNGTTALQTNDNGGVGLGSLIAWTAPQDGTYYLQVRGKPGQTGGYQLLASVEDDHGDDASSATATSDPSVNPGALASTGDVDWFVFTAVAGFDYRIEARLASLADSVLRLYDSDGVTLLAFDDDGGADLGSLIEWTAPKDGAYYVEVAAKLPEMFGRYELVITGEDDHGDSAAHATAIDVPTMVDGVIEMPFDVDWFAFEAVAGARYRVETMLGTLTDSQLRLVAADGVTQLAFDDDGGEGLASLIYWTAPVSGTYFIEVLGFQWRTGTYELSITMVDDHGDEAALATPMTDPSLKSGVIDAPTDVDWFSFPAYAGVDYELTAVLEALGQAALRVYDVDGVTILAEHVGSPGQPAVIHWQAPADGVFYVEVSAPDGAALGTYRLRLVGDDDHGDTRDQATALDVSTPKAGM
ncbi:MAG TPA: PPC domain-containing protein, partial [Lacipirellulaceae bacterium]|nr:PPC domain-containing protein [Lacipirellulaceae bacterium]